MVGRVKHRLDHRRDALSNQRFPFPRIREFVLSAGRNITLQIPARNRQNTFRIADQFRYDGRMQRQGLLVSIEQTIPPRRQPRCDRPLGNSPVHADLHMRQLALFAQVNNVLPRHAKPTGDLAST